MKRPYFSRVDTDKRREHPKTRSTTCMSKLVEKLNFVCYQNHAKIPKIPITNNSIEKIGSSRMLITNKETRELENSHRFKYQFIISILFFAYTICRISISYSISILVKYINYPSMIS